MQDHTHWMRRAVRLAMNGRGRVEPNPMVGCVIVKDGRLISEGYHEQFGGPHAEPNALAACAESPAGATVYVSLEPCCHTNKKTPPCVPRLIEAKVGRVVIGCLDPNPEVNGRGAEQLRAAGVEVVAPVLEKECRQLIAPFISRTVHSRPYVTLKWAETADGKIAGPHGTRLLISNAASTRAVHQLRSRYVSILVGINTVIADDPLLTPRGVECERGILRVILDRDLRLPLESRIVATAEEVETSVYHRPDVDLDRLEELVRRGVNPFPAPLDGTGMLSLRHVVQDIGKWPMLDAVVEPGPTLAESFFASGLVDRLWVFRSTNRADDARALGAPSIPPGLVESARLPLDGDVLTEYLNPASAVFFAAEPSADFVLASASSGGDDRHGATGVRRE